MSAFLMVGPDVDAPTAALSLNLLWIVVGAALAIFLQAGFSMVEMGVPPTPTTDRYRLSTSQVVGRPCGVGETTPRNREIDRSDRERAVDVRKQHVDARSR